MDLYGLKEDGMEVAKIGASALLGAAIAKAVTEIGAIKDVGGGYVAPLIPIAVGLGVHSYGKAQFPVAAPGVAAGMVAVGLGKLIGKLADAFGQKALAEDYVPFAKGLGYTYDSSIMGLGYDYGAGVSAYMQGAPTEVQIQGLGAGAPVQIQTVTGMLPQTGMAGLGSTIVGSGSPLSASLM